MRRLCRTRAATSRQSTPDRSTAPFINTPELRNPTSSDAVQPVFEAPASPQAQKRHCAPSVIRRVLPSPRNLSSSPSELECNLSCNLPKATGGGNTAVLQPTPGTNTTGSSPMFLFSLEVFFIHVVGCLINTQHISMVFKNQSVLFFTIIVRLDILSFV